jgi:hypothetical protein
MAGYRSLYTSQRFSSGNRACEAKTLTVIFAIAAHTQAPGLDSREAQPNGLAKRGRVDVRDPVLIADSAVREVKALAGNVAVRVWGVVGREPKGWA